MVLQKSWKSNSGVEGEAEQTLRGFLPGCCLPVYLLHSVGVPRELLLVALPLVVPTYQEVLLPILQVVEQAQDLQEGPMEVIPNPPCQEAAPSCLGVLQDLVDLAHYQDLLHFSMEHLQVDLGARHLVDPNCLGLLDHLVLDHQIYVVAETLALEVLLGLLDLP